MLKKFLKSVSGTTSIEYAIIASVIGAAIIVSVQGLGDQNAVNYDQIEEKVDRAMNE